MSANVEERVKDIIGEELGVEREHRVVMLMLDTVDFPVVVWGAKRAGNVTVARNTRHGADP